MLLMVHLNEIFSFLIKSLFSNKSPNYSMDKMKVSKMKSSDKCRLYLEFEKLNDFSHLYSISVAKTIQDSKKNMHP